MPKMLEDKKMKTGDCEFFYSKNLIVCKWMDNRPVLLVSTALEVMDDVLSVQMREKGSTTKSVIPCPTVVKLYNNGMGGVVLIDQQTAAYQLYHKSSVRFYLRIFFDLLDIACVNSFLVYDMKYPKQSTLLDCKIAITRNLIRWHQSRQRAVPSSRPSKRKNTSLVSNDRGGHYQSFNQHKKDAPIVQKKGKKTELLLYA